MTSSTATGNGTTPPATPNAKDATTTATPTRSLHSSVPRVRLNSKEFFKQQQQQQQQQQQYSTTTTNASSASHYTLIYPVSPSVSVETAPMTITAAAAAAGGGSGGLTVSSSFVSLPNLLSSSSTNTPTNNSSSSNNNNNHNSSNALLSTSSMEREPAVPPSPNAATTTQQHRFNSRDIPRSYTGQYQSGQSRDLLPMECMRSHQFLVSKVSFLVFASAYVTLILVLYFLATLFVVTTTTGSVAEAVAAHASSPPPPHQTQTPLGAMLVWFLMIVCRSSWTITNAIHCLITVLYVHWFQGSYLLLDEQGELNGMTIWEQLEATSESSLYMRRSLLIVPTVLCYTACLVHNFNPVICTTNILVWSIAMVGKLPMMNGVRLFGINRTAGIDE